MKWTTKAPTKPGWYFFRERAKDWEWICPVEVVKASDPRVRKGNSAMDAGVSKLWVIDKYIWSGNGDCVDMLDWVDRDATVEWAGPIPMPKNS